MEQVLGYIIFGTGWPILIIGTLYGFVDGAIAGYLFGWIYNMVFKCCPGKTA